MKTQIKCKVVVDGNVTIVDVIGVGAGCQELTKGLESALGIIDEKSRESTASAYQDVDPLKLTTSHE